MLKHINRRVSAGSAGDFFLRLLLAVTVIGLAGAVLYLMSDINHRRYRIREDQGLLVIERGRFLPTGFQPFQPETRALQAVYAPIPLPRGKHIGVTEMVEDRADIDRALFGLLAGWARDALTQEDPDALKSARQWIDRCSTLPGLSEQQRADLKTLRADASYRSGQEQLAAVLPMLQSAKEAFEEAVSLGTSRPTDAIKWTREIDRRIADFRWSPDTEAGPMEAPSALPPQGEADAQHDALPTPADTDTLKPETNPPKDQNPK